MRLISRFHDYYDSALGFGLDEKVVYKRETQDFRQEYVRTQPTPRYSFNYAGERHILYGAVVGFCGALYPTAVADTIKDLQPTSRRCYYSADDLNAFLVKVWNPNAGSKSKWRRLMPAWYRDRLYGELVVGDGQQEFFDPKTHARLEATFRERRVPTFVYWDGLVLNPRLADYQFQKVRDPFSAFQEISMYISGCLGIDENPMVTLSDEDKRDKKGFDKWSFKTRPGGKR